MSENSAQIIQFPEIQDFKKLEIIVIKLLRLNIKQTVL